VYVELIFKNRCSGVVSVPPHYVGSCQLLIDALCIARKSLSLLVCVICLTENARPGFSQCVCAFTWANVCVLCAVFMFFFIIILQV